MLQHSVHRLSHILLCNDAFLSPPHLISFSEEPVLSKWFALRFVRRLAYQQSSKSKATLQLLSILSISHPLRYRLIVL